MLVAHVLEWFDSKNGNTYNTVRLITPTGEVTNGMQYGYDSGLATINKLLKLHHVELGLPPFPDNTIVRIWARENDIKFVHLVTPVNWKTFKKHI